MGYGTYEFPNYRDGDSDLKEIIEMYLTVQALPGEWTDYKNELNQAWADYKNGLNNDWETYKNMMNNQWSNYQTNLNNQWTIYQRNLNDQWAAYKNLINGEIQDLKDFVNNFFDNLDVQQEINNKLDAMAADGSLTALIAPLVPTLVDNWLAGHITNPSNPPLDTSLTMENAAAPAKTTGNYGFKNAAGLIVEINNINTTDKNFDVKVEGGISNGIVYRYINITQNITISDFTIGALYYNTNSNKIVMQRLLDTQSTELIYICSIDIVNNAPFISEGSVLCNRNNEISSSYIYSNASGIAIDFRNDTGNWTLTIPMGAGFRIPYKNFYAVPSNFATDIYNNVRFIYANQNVTIDVPGNYDLYELRYIPATGFVFNYWRTTETDSYYSLGMFRRINNRYWVSAEYYGGTITVNGKILDASTIYSDNLLSNLGQYSGLARVTDNIKCVAHRGYSSIAPENTIPAYKLARQKGYIYVECDVEWTSDNIPVLLHDTSIDRTSNGTGNIADLTYEQVRQYDFGSWKNNSYAGTKIPSFSEFISYCKKSGLHPYIEIKGGITESRAQILYGIVYNCGMENNVTWISFNNSSLAEILKLNEKSRIGYLSGDISTAIEQKKQNYNVFSDLDIGIITDELINSARANDLEVEVWTVDSANTVKTMNDYISGVTTNSLLLWNYWNY